MYIREAKETDINQLAVVTVDTWRSAYAGIVNEQYLDSMSYERCQESWRSRLLDDGVTLVAVDDVGCIMGYAQAGPTQRADRRYPQEIYAIYVLPAYQRLGVGKQLFDAVRAWLASIGVNTLIIWALSDNPHRRFYEKLGGSEYKHLTIDLHGQMLKVVAYVWDDPQ